MMRYLLLLMVSSAIGMEMKPTKIQERIISNDIIIPYIFTDISFVYQYPFDHIRLRYQEDYGANESEARVVEFEFKNFMLKKHLNQPIVDPTYKKQVEDFWHISILHTRDYYKFCIKCFGKFIHHEPTPYENLNLDESKRSRHRSYSSPSLARKLGEEDDNSQ